MAVELKQLYAGGTDGNRTKIKTRVDLGEIENATSVLRVYAVRYAKNNSLMEVFVNGVKVDEYTATGNLPYVQNILLGGDEDNFAGKLPEVLIIKTTDDSISNGDITTYSRWLANKWLPTGSDFNGYTVQASAGAEPSFGTGYDSKWLHFDETTIQYPLITNYIKNTNIFGGQWTIAGGLTITEESGVFLGGYATARLTKTLSTSYLFIRQSTSLILSQGEEATFCFYAKNGNTKEVRSFIRTVEYVDTHRAAINFNFSTGNIVLGDSGSFETTDYSATNVGDDTYFIKHTIKNNLSEEITLDPNIRFNDNIADVHMFISAPQLVKGNQVASFIPTTSAPVTAQNTLAGICEGWNDKAGFGAAGNKTSVYENYPTSNKFEIQTLKGKNIVKFDGDNYLKINVQNAGVNQSADPDSFTLFFVCEFDNYDLSGGTGQGVICSQLNGGGWNDSFRIKKYPNEQFFNFRIRTGGGWNFLEVQRDEVLDIEFIPGVSSASLRLLYTKDPAFSSGVTYTSTQTLTGANKGAHIWQLTNLDYDTYYVKAELDSVVQSQVAKFRCFKKNEPEAFSFIFGSCNHTESNHIIWDAMREKNPDLFFHIGDLHYDDIATPDTDLFRNSFNKTVEQPRQKDFYSNQSNYYVWDDHDYGANNSDRDSPSRANALEFFTTNIPYNNIISDPETNGVSQFYDIGRCRFILTDCRSNRSDWLVEPATNPNKTVLGATTKAWFKSLLLDYKSSENLDMLFWMNPLGWGGDIDNPLSWSYNSNPDGWGENWLAFLAERKELANFMYNNNITNVVVCNGDTHMVAIDDGRNNLFATDSQGNRINPKNVNDNLKQMVIESSPFDRDPDRGQGPFQIDDSDDSGGPYPQGDNNFSIIQVNDLGSNWIEVVIEQFGFFVFHDSGNSLYKIREFKKRYNTKKSYNALPAPPPYVSPFRLDEGVVSLPEMNHSVLSTKIEITSPTQLSNMWRASITGRINGINVSGGGFEVRLYRRSDQDYFQAVSSVDTYSGEFILIPPAPASGTIVIKLIDTNFSFEVAEYINDGNTSTFHENLMIERWIATDIDYFSGQSIRVPSNKEFRLGYNYGEGRIKYKLKRTTDNKYVAETPLATDLSRSFLIDDGDEEILASPFPSRSYLYDMALAVISATGLRDFKFADRLIDGILVSQYANGAFPFSVNHINPNPLLQDPYFRVGAIAWVAYGLGYYLQYRPNPAKKEAVQTALINVLNYIQTLESNPIGLPTGGTGRYYIDSGSGLELFEPDYQIPWISTEHNIDYYFALKQAGRVLNSTSYNSKAETVKNLMLSQLWFTAENRFYQGIHNATTNAKDTAQALDTYSWGACMLFSAGEIEKANSLLDLIQNFEVTFEGKTGYTPYLWGYDLPPDPPLWLEGTFGVALAMWKAKRYNKYQSIMSDGKELEEEDGSYRYAMLRDDVNQISNYPSVASTTWFIIANRLKNSVWN
ncbi:hypothetical protein J2X69_003040 [Algoriphagus sp. 4150]|uniref:alkaline phosphatase D family protein n=1 Tax=Algoriphagus sp. 4150 TaxID=2817756 RepID=UPI0028564BEB|nr:alkaline phosphatase D family protein [Algoriphagus sp. 4150]MDR7130683.1 hypothetical protein [Algoriphagus sp. 4150]